MMEVSLNVIVQVWDAIPLFQTTIVVESGVSSLLTVALLISHKLDQVSVEGVWIWSVVRPNIFCSECEQRV